MKKRILSIFLVLTMLVGIIAVLPISIGAEGAITITSVEDWMNYLSGKEVGESYITVTANELDFAGKKVEPIKKFSGSFDGDGVVIKNVTMGTDVAIDGKEVGLFGCPGGDIEIRNLVITDSTFSGKTWVGALLCCTAGAESVVIENIFISSTVKVEAASGDKKNVGGIIGGLGSSTKTAIINDCVFSGTVSASKQIGGIVGITNGSNNDLQINNTLVTGKVGPGASNYSAGFVGDAYRGKIALNNCIYAGGAEGEFYDQYPFATYDGVSVSVTNCYTTYVNSDGAVYSIKAGDVKHNDSGSGVTYLNGDAAFLPQSVLIGKDIDGFSKRDGDIVIPNGLANNKFPALEIRSEFYVEYTPDWLQNYRAQSLFEINTAQQLCELSFWVSAGYNFKNKTVKLTDDIDMAGINFTPIGSGKAATEHPFMGTFDGNGKTVSNLFIKYGKYYGTGLFAVIEDATVKNFTLAGAYVESTDSLNGCNETGALVAYIKGKGATIDSVYVSATVRGYGNSVGGLVGIVQGSTSVKTDIKNCVFTGRVETNGDYVGGIVANGNNAIIDITDCLNLGFISGDEYCAGIVGRHDGQREININKCVNAGQVSGRIRVGSIWAGNVSKAEYAVASENCYYIEGTEPFAPNGTTGTYPSATAATAITLNDIKGDVTDSIMSVLTNWTERTNNVIIPTEVVAIEPKLSSSGNIYEVGSAADWATLTTLTVLGETFSGKQINLTKSIDFGGATIHPVFCELCCGVDNGLMGTFDGKGNTISNFNIDTKDDSASLFGMINGGTVQNLVIDNATVNAKNWAGIVSGEAKGDKVSYKNIYIGSDVVLNATGDACGGILGGAMNAANTIEFESCIFAGVIYSKNGMYLGGMIGNGRAKDITISSCMNTGRIVGNTYVAGMGTSEGGLKIENCVGAGTVIAKGSYYGDIYAGNPKGTSEDTKVSVNGCYYVDTLCRVNTNGEGLYAQANNTLVKFEELIGLDAKAPSTFTAREGDIAVPTEIDSMVSVVLSLKMSSGAAVRLDEPTGIRFKALLGGAFLNSIKEDNPGKTIDYGVIITPEDYVDEVDEFTVEELDKLNHSLNYLLAEASGEDGQLLAGGESEGYYLFTGVLAEVQPGNYERNFAARAYVSVDNGDGTKTYYYSDYDVNDNSRSIAYVAEKAYNDTSLTKEGVYQYEIADGSGVYSPYTQEQRALLPNFYNTVATDTYFLSYNVRNLEDKNVLGNLYEVPTYEYTNREKYVLAYLKSSGADVIGLQEVTKLTLGGQTLNWFDTLNGTGGLTDNGFSYYAGDDILPDDSKKDMWNPIYWNSTKFTESDKGCYDLGAYYAGTEKEELRRLTWVKLTDNETGEGFIYVNVHMPRVQSAAGDGQKEAAVKLKEFIQAQFANETCPIIIGGDFNGSYSDYAAYADGYFGDTAINARSESANKVNIPSSKEEDFITPDERTGPIDLYFALNTDNVDFHAYIVTDNKVYVTEESQEKYPSDHLPVKLIVTFNKNK